jgi:hypothetical protein
MGIALALLVPTSRMLRATPAPAQDRYIEAELEVGKPADSSPWLDPATIEQFRKWRFKPSHPLKIPIPRAIPIPPENIKRSNQLV